jgi:toxin ParE1/3/4
MVQTVQKQSKKSLKKNRFDNVSNEEWTNYIISKEAENDLGDIYDYTFLKFGHSQASFYLTKIEEKFQTLASQPLIGRKRDEIKNGLRSVSHESHVIFYRIMPTYIRIVRVLHGSRDVIRNF